MTQFERIRNTTREGEEKERRRKRNDASKMDRVSPTSNTQSSPFSLINSSGREREKRNRSDFSLFSFFDNEIMIVVSLGRELIEVSSLITDGHEQLIKRCLHRHHDQHFSKTQKLHQNHRSIETRLGMFVKACHSLLKLLVRIQFVQIGHCG
jgi:hypothetical protein